MKFIKTSNQIIELVETDKENNVISSNGFQLGELYFQIKNKKVSFYLNDSEKPFDSFVWSIDLPITIDGETYATEDEASAALSKIMVLEDINELKERLDAEILRSTNKDTEHDVLISGLSDDIADLDDRLADEIQDRISGDSVLNDKIDAEKERAIQKENAILNKVNLNTERISGLSDALDVEIQNRIAGDSQLQNNIGIEADDRRHADVILMNLISGLTDDLNDEVVRSTAKDAEHDTLISGLTDDLDVEVQNRIAGDAQLQNVIGIESDDRRHADALLKNLIDELGEDLEDESARALSAETRLEDKIDAEVVRSTAKDAEHDALISGLTNDIEDLDDKVDEAISAHTMIVQKLDDEISRAYSAETLINQALANEVVRAVSAETRIELKLDNEIQERKDADIVLSGAIDSLSAYCEDTYAKKEDLEALEDKVDQTISSITDDLQAEIARATAREDDIAEDLDDEFHRAQSAEHLLEDKITTERERALGAEEELREMIQTLELSGVTEDELKDYVSGYTYSKAESDAKYQPKLTAGENISIANNVISATDTKYSAGTNVQINGNIISATDTKYTAGTNVQINGNVISATDTKYSAGQGINISDSNVISTSGSVTEIAVPCDDILDHGIYIVQYGGENAGPKMIAQGVDGIITGTDGVTPAHCKDIRPDWNVIQRKLSAGSGISISDTNVISVTGGSQPVDAYTKAESDAKFATITNFNSHSGNTTMHVTSAEKATWNNKQDILTAGDNIDITNNVISTVTKFWCGTQAQYDAITIKDPNTVYMIHD